MKKVYTKKFENKNQMKAYYNKVAKNENIKFVVCGFFFEDGKWEVKYQYK